MQINYFCYMRYFISFLIMMLYCVDLHSQYIIQNPSFEDKPKASTLPRSWNTCNKGSTPDILPGPWGVEKKAIDGNTFLGLITREDGSYESIGQKLVKPLRANECYTLSVYLSRSNNYTGYNLPLRIRLWGGKTYCGKDQLLAESKAITHTNWVKYEFQIYTKINVHFLLIEACLAPGISTPYKGNILIDNLSEFIPCFRADITSVHASF